MSRYVILGHGSFNPESSNYPPEVLVPRDTTLQFVSEAGQRLTLPNKDYTDVALKMWDQLKKDGSPLPAGYVTYNFALFPDSTEEHRESAKAADWDGADVVFIDSGKTFLCTGDADRCPTPALLVQDKQFKDTGEGEAVPDNRWKHDCQGILGQLQGNELFWVACTSFTVATPDLPALDMASKRGPGLDEDLDWAPEGSALETVTTKNGENVKAVSDKGTISLAVGGALCIIGGGHPRRPGDYLKRQDDLEEGQLWVNKGGTFTKGSIQVEGISSKKQKVVKEAIAAFSKKKVTFV